jgi:hypothetical protein
MKSLCQNGSKQLMQFANVEPGPTGNKTTRKAFYSKRSTNCPLPDRGAKMSESAETMIMRNLVDALERLQEDLERVELWTSALGQFNHPIPEYRPSDQHLLPRHKPQHHART